MLFLRIRELIAQKERSESRRIRIKDVAEATGIRASVLSNLGSPTRQVVTTTANLEALLHYFACSPNELIAVTPPPGQAPSCNVDDLYPNRRPRRDE